MKSKARTKIKKLQRDNSSSKFIKLKLIMVNDIPFFSDS
jgi:hypothetical protein